jgi:hypothetical protein
VAAGEASIRPTPKERNAKRKKKKKKNAGKGNLLKEKQTLQGAPG